MAHDFWTDPAVWDQPMIFTDFATDPFDFGDFTLFQGDLPLMLTAPSALFSAADLALIPADLVDIAGNFRLPETIDWRTPQAWEFAMLNTDVAPGFLPRSGTDPLMGAVRSGLGLSPEQETILDRITVDLPSGRVSDPQSGGTWATVQEFLKSPLGASLGIAALGLVGTGIGQLAAGGGETLRLPERQPTEAETAARQAFSRALGQPSLEQALSLAGGTTAEGAATLPGSANLEALVRASLGGQRSVADLMARRAELEGQADIEQAPAEAAIRSLALRELPGFLGGPTTITPTVDPRLAALEGEIDRLMTAGPAALAPNDPGLARVRVLLDEATRTAAPGDPVAGRLRASVEDLLARGPAAFQQDDPALAAVRGDLAALRQRGPEGLVSPLTPDLESRVRSLLAGPEAYTDPALAQLRTRLEGRLATAEPLRDEIQQALGAEIARVQRGEVSNPALDRRLAEEERTQREFLARTLGPNYELSTAGQAALGELRQRHQAVREEDRRTTLATLAPLEESRRRFGFEFPEQARARELGLLLPEERARAEFGFQVPRQLRLSELQTLVPQAQAGREAAQANYARLLATLLPEERARFQFGAEFPQQAYARQLGLLLPEERARTQFGAEFPERTLQQRLALLLPEERARMQFGAEFPERAYQSRLATLLPEHRARYQFSLTQPLEQARFTEGVRQRGFEERLGLTGFGRRPPTEMAQTLGQLVPISPLLGIETEATRAQREALHTQAAIESFRARQSESASLAQQLGSVFGLAGAFGLGRGLTGA